VVELHVEQEGPFVVARLGGELTASTMEGVGEELHGLLSEPEPRLAIDLSGLQLVDSSGLGLLMHLVNRARMSAGAVVLVAPSPFVSGVFQVTRLNEWFDVCADLTEAGKKLVAG
jgi:anti-sigma B factor antagonist